MCGGGGGGVAQAPKAPPWIHHWSLVMILIMNVKLPAGVVLESFIDFDIN